MKDVTGAGAVGPASVDVRSLLGARMASIRTGQDQRQSEGPDINPEQKTYEEDQELVAHGFMRTIS